MVQGVDTPNDRIGYGNRRTRHIGIVGTTDTVQLVVDNGIVDNRRSVVGADTATVIIVNQIVEYHTGFGIDTTAIAITVAVEGRVGDHHRPVDETTLGVGSAVFPNIDGTTPRGKVVVEQTAFYTAARTVQQHTAAITSLAGTRGRTSGNGNTVESHVDTRGVEGHDRIEVVGTCRILRRVERSHRGVIAQVVVAQAVAREYGLVGKSPRLLPVTRVNIAIHPLVETVLTGINQGAQIVEYLPAETAVNHNLVPFQHKRGTALVAGKLGLGGHISTGGHPNLQRRVDVVPRVGRPEYHLQVGTLGGIGPRRTVERTGPLGRYVDTPHIIGRPCRIDCCLGIDRRPVERQHQQQRHTCPLPEAPRRSRDPSRKISESYSHSVPHIFILFYTDAVHR